MLLIHVIDEAKAANKFTLEVVVLDYALHEYVGSVNSLSCCLGLFGCCSGG